MLKIVLWTEGYIPEIGGLQISTARLAKELIEQGCEVTILTRGKKNTRYHEEDYIIRLSGKSVLDWVKKSGNWLLKHKDSFDVLHVIDYFYNSIDEQLELIELLGLPCALKIPTQGYVENLINTDERIKKNSRISAFIVLNSGIEKELTSVNVPKEKLYSIPNGIDVHYFSPPLDKSKVRNRLALQQDKIIVLYLGRLVKRKKIDLLINLAKSFPPHVKLLIVGDGGNDRDSQEQLVRKGLTETPSIILRPKTLEVRDYYHACDIHILVSEREGMPNSLIEAMACAIPSVVTNIPGINDIITSGEEGILVPVNNEFATASAIVNLCNDKALRLMMGEKARETAIKGFNISEVAKKYLRLYEEIKG